MGSNSDDLKPKEATEDTFYCSKEKFVKMLRFFGELRESQTAYFKSKYTKDLERAKALETKADKTIAFYLDNQDKLHDCPF